ncbi:solute carrier family 23 member 3 isoform X3 [Rhea pennata]|uniref:solute carrier family 23 member 3 isoform X3 n=1 Tax=Rhea pennata TaxID=8795 RepID=UPI002E26F677
MNGGCHRIPGAGSPPSCSWQKMCSCMLSCCLALQHLAVQASLLCIFHLLLLPTLPEEQPQAASELLARSLFACGISTILQTCLGSRLPLVQIPSFEYLVPAMVLSSHRSVSASADRNGTAAASVCPAPHCDIAGSRAASLREVSGAVVVSGLVQLVLGASGVCGWAARRCGPMVLAPSLSIVGLSAYKEAAFFCSANWGASAPRCHLLPASGVLPPALLCLGGLRGAVHPHPAHILGAAPICWHLHRVRHPQPPPHPLGLAGAGHGTAALGQQHWPLPVALDPLPRSGWAGLAPLSPSARALITHRFSPCCRRGRVAAAHPPGAGGGHRHGRRRQRQLGGLLRAVREAAASPPPAPGCLQPGPLRRGAGQPAGRAAGRRGRHGLQHRQRLRQQPHAGWLSPLGASERTGVRAAGHVPQAGRAPHPHPAGGSRRGALRDLRCGCGHGYLLLPVRGHRLREEHLYCRLHHVHGPAGATVAQHHSGSLGHSPWVCPDMLLPLPGSWAGMSWVTLVLPPGWVPLDLLFLSLLMVPVFLTGFLSFFLENTVSGTLEERGLLAKVAAARRGDRCPWGERGDTSHVYGLPAGLRRLLPPSRCKAFPCCFLCPGREEEEEEEGGGRAAEEGTATTGEGTHLLLKVGTVEMQSERRPSETEMPVWHAAA